MLIYDLIDFCDEEYQNGSCDDCTGAAECSENCDGDCKECLDDIHYHCNNRRDDYDCERLLDYYVCRYSYKYCSEIVYALREVDLSKYPYFNILSLGCGGAPDLMAFEHIAWEDGYEQEITYYGIDRNDCWEKVHNFIENNFVSGKADFSRNIDVLTYFRKNKLRQYNVLVIEYLVSFFYNELSRKELRSWFTDLTESVIKNKPKNSPMLIIINDADSCNTGRDDFEMLAEEIEKAGLKISLKLKKRFQDNNFYTGSEQYKSDRNLFEIPDNFPEDYCVAKYCKSAQLILEVR